MPRASIVVPAYNTLATLPETLASLRAQSFSDLEIVVVDDGSTDGSADWVASVPDPRVRLVRQENRGLAGARNGGIAAARGAYVGFCDGDDLWAPDKLARHVAFLDARPDVGLSYSASAMIDADGRPLVLVQRPKTEGVDARDVLLRNPVGNGSAPVMRRAALDAIAFRPPGSDRDWWFDETFRQSEDIECWMRLALSTDWKIAGLPEPLTSYRIVASGLSARLARQHESWERMAEKVGALDPAFAARWIPPARAYQLRYLARRAVTLGDGRAALDLLARAAAASLHPLWHEPAKTVATLGAAAILAGGGRPVLRRLLPGAVA